jgi:hypothetical protein
MEREVDFSFIADAHTRSVIKNGYTAVSQLELWDWLKTFEVEANAGFMFSGNRNVHNIGVKMHSLPDDPQHSGSSFGFTMRTLQFIAKNGIDKYREEFQLNNR